MSKWLRKSMQTAKLAPSLPKLPTCVSTLTAQGGASLQSQCPPSGIQRLRASHNKLVYAMGQHAFHHSALDQNQRQWSPCHVAASQLPTAKRLTTDSSRLQAAGQVCVDGSAERVPENQAMKMSSGPHDRTTPRRHNRDTARPH